MIIVFDCFKQVKGVGKSIGIYNLALNLVTNIVQYKCKIGDNANNVKLIVLGNKYNASDFEIEGVDFVEINELNPLNKIHCIWWELFEVTRIAKKYKADRIVFPRGFCALSKSVKDTIIVHDLIPFYYNEHYPDFFNKLENTYIMLRLKSSIKRCNQVITISEASKADIVKYCTVDSNKITVIHNGCNAINYDAEKKTGNYIVAITSGLPHKNAVGILKAYEAYCKMSEKPMNLVVVGIEDSTSIYKLPDEINEKITCHKFIKENKDLHALIANSAAFMFLSLVEGFGFPPIEAMQLDVPVICSNLSSLPEVVGNAAILVDPNNAEDVARAMINVTTDIDKANELIKKGKDNIKRFSWDSRAELYWKAFMNGAKK